MVVFPLSATVKLNQCGESAAGQGQLETKTPSIKKSRFLKDYFLPVSSSCSCNVVVLLL